MIFVIALIKMRPCNKVSLVKQYVQVYSTYSGGSGGSGRLSRRKYTVRILTLCASLSSIMAAVGNQTNKHFSAAQKTAAVQMRKANVPLKTIRNQLKLSKSTLQRILAHAKHNPHEPVKPRKAGTGKAGKVPQGCLRQMKQMLRKNPCLTAKQLKERIPGFANVTVRWIQCLCKDKLKMPSRKMAKKPLLNQRMMDQGSGSMEAGELKSGNLSCSQMKATLSCIWGHSLAAAEGLWGRTDSPASSPRRPSSTLRR